jgi:hypothetical protein
MLSVASGSVKVILFAMMRGMGAHHGCPMLEQPIVILQTIAQMTSRPIP